MKCVVFDGGGCICVLDCFVGFYCDVGVGEVDCVGDCDDVGCCGFGVCFELGGSGDGDGGVVGVFGGVVVVVVIGGGVDGYW